MPKLPKNRTRIMIIFLVLNILKLTRECHTSCATCIEGTNTANNCTTCTSGARLMYASYTDFLYDLKVLKRGGKCENQNDPRFSFARITMKDNELFYNNCFLDAPKTGGTSILSNATIDNPTKATTSSSDSSSYNKTALIISLIIIGVVIILGILGFCCCRRKVKKGKEGVNESEEIGESHILTITPDAPSRGKSVTPIGNRDNGILPDESIDVNMQDRTMDHLEDLSAISRNNMMENGGTGELSRTYLTGEYGETQTHKDLQEVNKETNNSQLPWGAQNEVVQNKGETKMTNNSQIAWGDDDVIQRKEGEMGIEVGMRYISAEGAIVISSNKELPPLKSMKLLNRSISQNFPIDSKIYSARGLQMSNIEIESIPKTYRPARNTASMLRAHQHSPINVSDVSRRIEDSMVEEEGKANTAIPIERGNIIQIDTYEEADIVEDKSIITLNTEKVEQETTRHNQTLILETLESSFFD